MLETVQSAEPKNRTVIYLVVCFEILPNIYSNMISGCSMPSNSSMLQVVHKRLDILRFVCKERPTKRELVGAASKSRPTVDRAIRELEKYNLVRRANGLCKPTFAGRKACELYVDVKDSFSILDDTNTELSSLPLDAELSTAIFRGGSVFQPPDHAPYKRIEPMYDDLSEGNSLVAAARVFLPPYINQILSRGASGAMNMDLLIHDQILDALPENQKSTLLECVKSGETVLKVDQLVEYSLFLIDDEILYIAVHSDTNHLSLVIRNTSHQAIQWAKTRFSEIKESATPLRM